MVLNWPEIHQRVESGCGKMVCGSAVSGGAESGVELRAESVRAGLGASAKGQDRRQAHEQDIAR